MAQSELDYDIIRHGHDAAGEPDDRRYLSPLRFHELAKNGRTKTGQQKFHCKDCNLYGTLDTKDQERRARQKTVEQLHQERLSQRAIARITGMSRNTIAAVVRKSPGTN